MTMSLKNTKTSGRRYVNSEVRILYLPYVSTNSKSGEEGEGQEADSTELCCVFLTLIWVLVIADGPQAERINEK